MTDQRTKRRTTYSCHKKNKVLCPDLCILEDYGKKPPDSYWENFPKNSSPESPLCDIYVVKLIEMCKEKSHLLTDSQKARADTCADSLVNGADSCQKFSLPSCFQKNAANTITHGKEVADAIASWLRKGFAAGPFDSPPLR
jgi:hypothetical protein